MNSGSLSVTFNTANAVATNGTAAAFSPPNSSSGIIEIEVTARNTGTGTSVSWLGQLAWKKDAAGVLTLGTLANVGGAVLASFSPSAADTAAFAGSIIGIIASAGALTPQVTGLVATNITWTIITTYYVNP
jgi:hypothetical protein